MARTSSDIEFGKLALLFGFTSKENIYSAIRETALLQELGISKRLSHVVYERNFLTPIQIQSLLWALFCSNKINRFPARVVYEFTEEDDKIFLEKAMGPVNLLISTIRTGKNLAEAMPQQPKGNFPQDVLIYCLELQQQLQQKGFPRSLLSIISAKGYLQGEYRRLVPNIDAKKMVVSSPDQAKSQALHRRWEGELLASVAVQKSKLTPEQARVALEIGEKLGEQQLNLRFSEVLHYLGYMSKSDLTKLGVFISEITHLDPLPRFNVFDLNEEERQYVRLQIATLPTHVRPYQECEQTSQKLQKLGITIPPEELLLHKGYASRSQIKASTSHEKAAIVQSTAQTEYFQLSPNRPGAAQPAIEGEPRLTKRVKKELAAKMMPFSMDTVEKEFASHYLEERKSLRSGHKPQGNINAIITELSQTQLIPFQEITVGEGQNLPLPGAKIATVRKALAPGAAPLDIQPPAQSAQAATEYISIDAGHQKAGAGKLEPAIHGILEHSENVPLAGMEQTGYIAINATAEEIKELSDKIAENMGPAKPLSKVLWALFIVGTGIAIIEPKFKELFAKPDALFTHICNFLVALLPFLSETIEQASHVPIYTALSMFIVFLPSLFIGDWLGKMADRGHVHRLYFWGFLIYAASLPLVALMDGIYYHCAMRFLQGIGLAAAFIAAEFCISRWYGPLERGRIMGFGMMVFTAGFCLGFELPLIFDKLATLAVIETLGMSGLLLASCTWAFVSLFVIPMLFRLKVERLVTEDDEEEKDLAAVVIPKKPLMAAALYGVLEVAFFAVFFPYYPDYIPLWGNVPTETLIVLFGIGVLISSYVLGYLGDQIGPVPILTTLALVAIITFCALPLATAATAKFLFFLIGIVIGGLCPLGFSWLLESTDNERYFGKASGAFAMYEGGGSMLGCILCGVVFMLWGAKGFFLLLSLIFVGYFYLLITSPIRERRQQEAKVRGLLRLLSPAE